VVTPATPVEDYLMDNDRPVKESTKEANISRMINNSRVINQVSTATLEDAKKGVRPMLRKLVSETSLHHQTSKDETITLK